MRAGILIICGLLWASESMLPGNCCADNTLPTARLEPIRLSPDGSGFVRAESGNRFVAWGVNYDHDHSGRLIEDYWNAEWRVVEGDFREIKALGANVVRVHLQVAKFMKSQESVNEDSLGQLARLVALAERTGLYLDITGLGCYHKQDVPVWYDELGEADRWKVQALFWEAVAKTCSGSPAIFCYDLMNEPILPGKEGETDWLAGEFGGKHFVQRITLELAGRTPEQAAKAWVDTLVAAIRTQDRNHLTTVGVIPWALTWPKAKPLFYAPEVAENLDFASVHFYPHTGEVARALDALAVYDIGKPVVVEEMFPLKCSVEDLERFIDASRNTVDGYIGFYWGRTLDEYTAEDGLPGILMKDWLRFFSSKVMAGSRLE